MRITWRDGVTTLAAVGAITLERAFFHDWDWPLISNMRWTLAGLVVLGAVGFVFSYVLDRRADMLWTVTAWVLGLGMLALTALGLIFTNSDYVVLLMLNVVVFWFVSIVRHLTVSSTTAHPTHA